MTHIDKKSGFSLIELMVVVALLSVAAALLVPRFMKHQQEIKTEEAGQPSK
ncbi:MAG: prepilin-type N-terminal cleavage/methylation domain-containing protein [Deltaproteobacteria bacterium]|nr:prepilin-type N-terminal cleavage/methylation domain-containing protein [Deltaproteobacteria bacterium]MBI2499964.1 prepilin-type N-terminal cleavage/methylation domain-containing protein [Deltaproteobacteria bacterium]MBI4196264.1 prepilin-type N-terminal cleavage/methylation domain-containing protein [Deltaproteobacteria bacterium]